MPERNEDIDEAKRYSSWCNTRGCNLLCELLDELARRRAADAWIPCAERMPENHQMCLAIVQGEVLQLKRVDARDRLAVSGWASRTWIITDRSGEVTHWRPMPLPPADTKGTENAR